MNDLKAFLNPIKEEHIKYVVSKRFLDENKNPIEWEIKSLTSDEDENLRNMCMKKVPIVGKRGQYTQELDINKYIGLLVSSCTVYPNLNDKELQDGYKVMGADSLLKAMLKPGEYAEYAKKVQEINGFDTTMEELVEEAKN